MEWVIIGVNGVGVGIIVYFLTKQKKTLLAEIQSHKRTLENAQRFMDMFDLDKIEKYVQISERTFQRETEEKIKNMEKETRKKAEEYEEKMTKGEDFNKHLAREYRIANTLALQALHLIAVPELGIRLIRNTEESLTKEIFTEHIEDLKKAPTLGHFYDLAQSLFKQPTEKKETKKDNNAIVPKDKKGSLARNIAKKKKE